MKIIKTIIENRHLNKILHLLDEAGVLASTVEVSDHDEKKTFKKNFKSKYTLLITTCTDSQKTIIVNKIFRAITLIGGICIA